MDYLNFDYSNRLWFHCSWVNGDLYLKVVFFTSTFTRYNFLNVCFADCYCLKQIFLIICNLYELAHQIYSAIKNLKLNFLF